MTATISRVGEGPWQIWIVTGTSTVMTKEVPSPEVGAAMLRQSGWIFSDQDDTWTLHSSITVSTVPFCVSDLLWFGSATYFDLNFTEFGLYGYALDVKIQESTGVGMTWFVFSFRARIIGGDEIGYTASFDPVLDLCTLGDFQVAGLGFYDTAELAKLKAVEFFEKQKERYGGADLYAAALCARILRVSHRTAQR